MKILSKYKDYYDYLTGVYGIDPLLVLDRREFTNYVCIGKDVIILHICGYKIEGFYDGKDFYYADSLLKISECRKDFFSKQNYVYIKNHYHKPISVDIVKSDVNDKLDCPIIIEKYGSFMKYPILSNLGLHTVYPAEKIYQMLIDWLSEKKNKKENKPDKRTNKEKITGKGFDYKTSFRPKIKTI